MPFHQSGYSFATIRPRKTMMTAWAFTPTLPLALFRMAIIIYPRHGIWYIAWVGISNPPPLMGSLQYAHIRFMWNRKIFLISLPQQNTNFETSTRARVSVAKVLQLRPTSTRTMAGDTIKVFSTWDRVVVMCWLSAHMRTGRAMTMFYAGTPITCIWCDKSRYMTSHVVLVVITTFWIWPLPDILRQVRARSIDSIHIGYSFCDQCDK